MKRPNILIIYTDQQRWDALGANQNSDIITPNLDRLANEGINFDHAFVQNPVCMPSRLSFLTGQYPSTLKVTHMGVPVPQDTVTLPKMLKNYGYRSANIGKLHFLPHANRDHREVHPSYGFDHLEISDEPGCYEDAYRAWVRAKAKDQLDLLSCGLPPETKTWQTTMGIKDNIVHPEDRKTATYPFQAASNLTHSAFVAEQTIQWLKGHSTTPFLCIAGFYSPHSPWVVPQEFLDMYDPAKLKLPKFPSGTDCKFASEAELRSARQGYYAMVTEMDHYVGKILDQLEAQGVADNTIVIFTSDHGEWLGEHGKYGKGYPGPDCVSRVPLLIRIPKSLAEKVRKGQTVSHIVEAVDVIPTILDLAGIQIPSHLQGVSLFAENYQNEGALMEVVGSKIFRTENFRYVVHDDGKELLFDLKEDPGEYFNVAADSSYQTALADHRRLLLKKLLRMERPKARTWRY
jgi:arylsulfatase